MVVAPLAGPLAAISAFWLPSKDRARELAAAVPDDMYDADTQVRLPSSVNA